MLMAAFCQAALLIGPFWPLMVAEALVMVVLPKFASGRTPKFEEGASTIHSAEERLAPGADWRVLNDLPVVLLMIDRVNAPVLYTTEAEMLSPACTTRLVIVIEGFGYISYQA